MFNYCRYKPTVTKLITLHISHCTLWYNIVISHCTDLHLLQIQTYCHKANHTTHTTLHSHTIFLHPTRYGTYQRREQTLILTWKGMGVVLLISGLLLKREIYEQLPTYKLLHGVRHTNVSSQTKNRVANICSILKCSLSCHVVTDRWYFNQTLYGSKRLYSEHFHNLGRSTV